MAASAVHVERGVGSLEALRVYYDFFLPDDNDALASTYQLMTWRASQDGFESAPLSSTKLIMLILFIRDVD